MAVYFLNVKTFGRSTGGSAPSAAAYRAGERIHDERTGRTHDHAARQDVLHKEIILPGKFAADDMSWAKDRATLWNTAESAEKRGNARVAREYLVALPFELSAPQRLELVRGFAQELTDRHGFALDLTVHSPRDYPDSDPRNYHAHLLATTREITLEGFGPKTALEMSDYARLGMGLKPAIHELFHARERWGSMTNDALREAQVEARIDHRSLEAQGIDREPRPQIPRAAFEMERQGFRNSVAEGIRAGHAERVRERQERSMSRDAAPPAKPQTLEEIRREAREDWVRMRQASGAREREPNSEPERAREAPVPELGRGADDDVGM